jgi:hypothetical protein
MNTLLLVEDCPFTIEFFKLKESIGLLCSSLASPAIIAKLIQLSKYVRYLVWNFLTDPDVCNRVWREEFYKELYKYRDKRSKLELTYWNLHPIFAPFGGTFPYDRYYVSNILISGNPLPDNKIDLLMGCYVTCIEGGAVSYPSWRYIKNIPAENCFHWYFVTQALTFNMNRMILHNSKTRWWAKEHIVSNDNELFISDIPN